jgi:hypothetical protein
LKRNIDKIEKVLPWLTKSERDELYKRITNSCLQQLNSRHWGTLAPGKSSYGQPKFYISDIRGLYLIAGIIKYTLGEMNTSLFYRGQTKDYPLRPSVYRNFSSTKKTLKEIENLENKLNFLKDKFVLKGPDNHREALAQHYGLKTRWLDVLDHFQTAAWFAFHRENYPIDNNAFDGCKADDDVGYIYLVACPNSNSEIVNIDLRKMPSDWLRPHIQQAFSIKVENALDYQGDYSFLSVITLIVQRKDLEEWSNYRNLPKNFIYPNVYQDTGLKHWLNAELALIQAGI